MISNEGGAHQNYSLGCSWWSRRPLICAVLQNPTFVNFVVSLWDKGWSSQVSLLPTHSTHQHVHLNYIKFPACVHVTALMLVQLQEVDLSSLISSLWVIITMFASATRFAYSLRESCTVVKQAGPHHHLRSPRIRDRLQNTVIFHRTPGWDQGCLL